jgi:tRNA-dihydrouridine synthase
MIPTETALHAPHDTWPSERGAFPRRPEAAAGLAHLPAPIEPGQPLTVLAPMQDVTDLDFMRIVARRGAPDFFVTEYFRVHSHSTPEPHILRSVLENDTGRPVFAQILGENTEDIGRTLRELLRMPWAGIDLNMGCPAPKIYRKHVGGGLLRDTGRIDELLGFLRASVPGLFTVKTRIGFEDTSCFGRILELLARHRVDLLTLHARTVREMYRSGVHYEFHRAAAALLPCPVIANGNVTSAAKAVEVLQATGADGLMVGRSAIRNPWIFAQIRDRIAGRSPKIVTLGEVAGYIRELRERTARPDMPERAHVNRLKKFMNFVGLSVDPHGAFLHDARRVDSYETLDAVLHRHLESRADEPFSDEPYPGLIARPSREACEAEACG